MRVTHIAIVPAIDPTTGTTPVAALRRSAVQLGSVPHARLLLSTGRFMFVHAAGRVEVRKGEVVGGGAIAHRLIVA